MKQNTKTPGTDDKKFHKQIDDLNKLSCWRRAGVIFAISTTSPTSAAKMNQFHFHMAREKDLILVNGSSQKQQKNKSDE